MDKWMICPKASTCKEICTRHKIKHVHTKDCDNSCFRGTESQGCKCVPVESASSLPELHVNLKSCQIIRQDDLLDSYLDARAILSWLEPRTKYWSGYIVGPDRFPVCKTGRIILDEDWDRLTRT